MYLKYFEVSRRFVKRLMLVFPENNFALRVLTAI